MQHTTPTMAQEVLNFWFDEDNKPYWFEKNKDFDSKINEQFKETLESAKAGELAHWRVTAKGRLAEIIMLDQFSRNLYRDSPKAFAQDSMALVLAQEAIKQDGYDDLPQEYRKFTIMPFMHSESAKIHEQGLPLFEALDDDYTLGFEKRHKEIIDRFGRYPHRNEVMGRESTDDEIEFLQEPDSSF